MLEKSSDKRWLTAKRVDQLRALVGYVLWVAICFIGSQLFVVLLLTLLGSTGIFDGEVNQNIVSLSSKIAAFLVMVAAVLGLPKLLWNEPTSLRTLGLHRLLKWSDIGLALLGIVIAFAGSILILTLASHFMSWVDLDETQNLGVTLFNSGFELALAFVVFVIIGPIAEEVIFRGFLYGKLREKGIPFWLTTLVVSALFAIAHWQWNVALDVFFLSVVMCFMREKTGSIWAAIFMHMIKNGVAFYFTFVHVVMSGL